MNNPNHDKMADEQVLEDYFQEAITRLDAVVLPSIEVSSVTSDDIRTLILKAQTETPGYGSLKESIRARVAATEFADRMDQTARETYARLNLEATCRKILKIELKELTDSTLQEFFALCKAAVNTDAVRQYLRYGTPLFGEEISGSFPQERMVQVQKKCLESLGLDYDKATELIRQRFFEEQACDDPLAVSFDSMVTDVRKALQDVTDSIMAEDSNDGITRVVSVQHSEKLIDTETGEEIPLNEYAELAPTSEIMHSEPLEISSSLLARASLLQKQMREELAAMSEETRNNLLIQADETADEVLREALAMESTQDRLKFMGSLSPNKQRLMALKKVWEAMAVDTKTIRSND